MSGDSFQFKQFAVSHSRCGMKVGTDGVLLGAWANVQNAQTVLDIGTGCGLIALMVAQRNSRAQITAIDINAQAACEAQENVDKSIFANRIKVEHQSLQDFSANCQQPFDAIITNPPFFTNGLLSPSAARAHARHSLSMPDEQIFAAAKRLLTPNGKLSLIYPVDAQASLVEVAAQYGLFPSRITTIFPTPGSAPKRVLMEFSLLNPFQIAKDELVIEIERHIYSDTYQALVHDFYLNM